MSVRRLVVGLVCASALPALSACGGSPSSAPPLGVGPLQSGSQPHAASLIRRPARMDRAAAVTRAPRSTSAAPVTCTPVDTGGYYGTVTVAVIYTKPIVASVVDGGFCDVAVYIPATAKNPLIAASIVRDATMVGVLAQNASNVTVTHDVIQDVGPGYAPGDAYLYGLQEGVDVDFETSSGQLDHNFFISYQKNGTEFYDSNLSFTSNVAIGTYGPPNDQVEPGNYDIIAQNGFEVDYSVVNESRNMAFANQYNNPNDLVYDREATGFLYFGATIGRRAFTCADFVKDQDVAPYYKTQPLIGNDIPFYTAPNYTVDGTCPITKSAVPAMPTPGTNWNG
ncbi:MAG TPA: hypothetical protein VFB22_04215 [Candidatus Baltobacteraceae bacterium]|nr:hypothetical protein [Candidatus Baltobacteraceae bacterium]